VQAYLFGIIDKYILLSKDDPTISLYVDAAFAVHPRDSASHSGIYITLGKQTRALYAWSSKIKAVCSSIYESELWKLVEACGSLWKLVEGVQQTYPLARFHNEI